MPRSFARGKIIGAALGTCVHVAGLEHFLHLCEMNGWIAVSLGAAVKPERLIEAIIDEDPDLVAISYRLKPEDLVPLLQRISTLCETYPCKPRFIFGGTPPCCKVAQDAGLFDIVFDGTQSQSEVLDYILGRTSHR